ncbi:unnamed protein product [Triticum turgidum subsp. durum]|uniref:CDP-diacylglycerol--glycerol-3-phosphate 3-phosphatidyltransferase n=1 Tax=Triticum turgidum subsp. durum TaxID=4567 RepID=A0A9R0WDY2_TRITD|nr:unnamed protein product [Triticum turgidum subsp. durum]
MPSSIATHLLKAAAAKPLFSPRAAQIPALPRSPAARRPPAPTAAACRWFRWPSPARGLCSSPHSGPAEGMGSDGTGARRRLPPANGVSKEVAPLPQPVQPRLLTLPTVLTIGRVAAVPFLISTFYMDGPWAATATTGIFLAAAITDWLDGYIARKVCIWEHLLVHFLILWPTRLMVAATLVLLCTKPLETSLLTNGPWLLTVPSIAIIGREITMSAVREWAASQNTQVLEAVAVNNLGKWKTATQMTALTLLLASRDPSLHVQGALVPPGVALLYASAGLAIWSLVVYIRNIWRILLK